MTGWQNWATERIVQLSSDRKFNSIFTESDTTVSNSNRDTVSPYFLINADHNEQD